MQRNSAMTSTRPLPVEYASSPDADVLEDPRPQTPREEAGGARSEAGRVFSREGAELGAVIDDFMRAAEEGEAEDAYGQQYAPERLRDLHSSLSHVKSELGTMRIDAIRRWHVQGMLDELRRAGLAPGRLTSIVEGLDSVYRYAIQRGLVEDSPVIWLTFPQQAERVPAPTMQSRTAPSDPELVDAPVRAPTSMPAESAIPPTQAMLALGSRVLLWTMRVTVTIFVLVAIVLILQFA